MYKRFFGAIYDPFMHSIEQVHLRFRRARLLAGISGKVLEIGVGTGSNFEHYGSDIELLGFEPSASMLKRAERKRADALKASSCTLLNIGCGDAEVEHLIQPASLDAVVCTLVLCSIPDPSRALRNYLSWLKPGGKLLILEHIRSHHSSRAKLQDLFTPAWRVVADGCHLNRPTDTLLAESGFELVREERFKVGLPFYEAEYVKPKSG